MDAASHDPRRPHRQDTFDLRDQMLTDAASAHQHHPHPQQHQIQAHDDEEHSVLEDDSQDGEEDDQDEFMDEDDSSSLSIPNETIDFDLVYSLHTFVATVEGQANVVKGDSLFLMDDSNSYWWLVRVLKTQEVGYIPAENIETPYERLARLNKHRNVDLAAASPDERAQDPLAYRQQQRAQIDPNARDPTGSRRVLFRRASVFHYPPAVWNEEEQEGWEADDYEAHETGYEYPLNDEDDFEEDGDEDSEWHDIGAQPAITFADQQQVAMQQPPTRPLQLQQPPAVRQGQQQQGQYQQDPRYQLQQQQQQPSQQYGADRTVQPQGSNQSLQPRGSDGSLRATGSNSSLRGQGPREGPSPTDARSGGSSGSISPAGAGAGGSPHEGAGGKQFDFDSMETSETRKIIVTPSVARDQQHQANNTASNITSQAPSAGGPLLPSAILAQQDARKRDRERDDAEDQARKKRAKEGEERSSSQNSNRPEAKGKLQKQPSKESAKEKAEREKAEKAEKKDKPGFMKKIFGGGNKKDDKSSSSSTKVGDQYEGRGSSLSVSDEANGSLRSGLSTERGGQPGNGSMESSAQGHGLRVQQMDKQQQAAYQQWLESNAGKKMEPSYATQSAALFNANSSPAPAKPSSLKSGTAGSPGQGAASQSTTSQSGTSQWGEKTGGLKPGSGLSYEMGISGSGHQRPGSLIFSVSQMGLQGGTTVPELSVMRVFAGSNLATEATFKTVLLNTSTTAADLVKQAMQRFRVAAGEDSADYYLTVKTQVEGSFRDLQPHEKPLSVFDDLVKESADDEMPPTVKRSSIASISSISSNLSMHPAIRRLPMNDFTDDSAVKFYLNRYEPEDHVGNRMLNGMDDELPGPEGGKHQSLMSMGSTTDEDPFGDGISAPNSTNSNLAAGDRVTSANARFAVQVLIYPDDLPDGMIFDPHTEAIVPKSSLRDRTPLSSTASTGIPQSWRKKVFQFPKNTTVAEVIELGLERFGIPEGVVDGGDEVEDKATKRRSATRVRYGLSVLNDGQERELLPSSKVLDAFPRPPSFRAVDQRRSTEGRRRSADVTLLLGSVEDVDESDPIFILRRAVAYRMNNAPRNRLSAPLDDVSLYHLQAQRESITNSETSTGRDDEPSATPTPTTARSGVGATPTKPPEKLSRQEIIAAQRAASRDKQRAILSAQSNSEQGVDVILPGKVTIRSSRLGGTTTGAIRYSYVEPDGETYDISHIMEEEFEGGQSQEGSTRSRSGGSDSGKKGDFLEAALGRNGVAEPGQHHFGENINRIVQRVRADPTLVGSSGNRISAIYADKEPDVTPPPSRPQRAPDRAPSRSGTPNGPRGVTSRSLGPGGHLKQSSLHSLDGSEPSNYETPAGTPNRVDNFAAPTRPKPRDAIDSPSRSFDEVGTEEDHYLPPRSARKRPLLVLKDHDFGLSRMMAVIEMNAAMRGPAPWQANSKSAGQRTEPRTLRRQQSMLSSDTIVDDVLFGPKVDMEELHPRIREIYEPVAKRLDDLDKQIDDLLFAALKLSNRGS